MVIEHVDVLEKVNRILRKDYKNKSLIETIEALVDHIDKADKEFALLTLSVDEDDAMIVELQKEVKKLTINNNLALGMSAAGLVKQTEDVEKWFKNQTELVERNQKLNQQLYQANERIKELEDHVHTVAKHHFETGLVKAGYMDLDD